MNHLSGHAVITMIFVKKQNKTRLSDSEKGDMTKEVKIGMIDFEDERRGHEPRNVSSF